MINATSGILCAQNVRFTSGINAESGISATLPNSIQALYPFLNDFEDDASKDYQALFDNIPSFGVGGVNTVANTNLQVTTFQKDGKGVYLDRGDKGVAVTLGSFTSGTLLNGVAFDGELGATSNFLTFRTSTEPDPTTGKFVGLVTADFENSIIELSNGSAIRFTNMTNDGGGNFDILRGTTSQIRAGLEFPNSFPWDFSFSDFFPSETGAGSVAEVRTNAGDNVTGVPAAKQWDTSGDFRYGYTGIGKTVADITSQILLQTGNMGISTGIGITFAEIGASISALSVTSDTIVGECFIKYVGGMLSIVIDGVESTPVASAAPVIGAFSETGANVSNMLAAPGTYGGLIFEAL